MKTVASIAVLALLGSVSAVAAQERVTDWRRVSLAEKDEVWLTLDGAPILKRIVLSADAANVTVLNDVLPGLDERARRELRGMARHSPDSLLLALGRDTCGSMISASAPPAFIFAT